VGVIMDYKKLYERQYGEKKLVNAFPRQFLALRRILKKWDWDRYNVAEYLIKPGGNRILDIGCGEGYLMRKLSGRYKELYGLDISPSRLKEAEEKIKELYPSETSKFKFIEGNADDPLPFPDDFFDATICIATIEHVYNIFSLVKEIYRILKPGGYVVTEVPNIAMLKYRIQLLIGKLPVTSSPYNWKEIGWDGGHIHYFTKKTFCRLLEEYGFKVLRVTGSGLFAKFRGFILLFLLEISS
jgi:ubiquinone/menaquinone biosynthesis C-methylase UbiE